MENIMFWFNKKSLVLSEVDYNIFKNENYIIDDGTYHTFVKDKNALLILDKDKHPQMSIWFNNIELKNKQLFEIERIYYVLKKPIDPEKEANRAKTEIWSAVINTFSLLNNIIEKRSQNNKDNLSQKIFDYYFYNKEKHTFDKLSTFENRINYLQLLPKLEFDAWFQ